MKTEAYIGLYVTLIRKAVSVSWSFIFLGIVANVLNLVFNIYLGGALPSEEYALIVFLISVLYIASIFFTAIINTVNHVLTHSSLSRNSVQRIVYIGVAFSFLWATFSPTIAHLFHIDKLLPIILFAPVFTFGIIMAFRKGVLRSRLRFQILGFIFFIESLSRLLIAVSLVRYDLEYLAYISVPISIALAYFITMLIPDSKIPNGKSSFSTSFFSFSLLTGLSTIAFLSIDIILVKLYFSPDVAGQYAILALTGKMLYFLGSLLNDFIIPLVSREDDGKDRSRHLIYLLFIGVVLLVASGVLFFQLFGSMFLMILFGEKALMVIPLIPKYIFAIGMFTISMSLVLYNIAKKQYIFSLVNIIFSFIFLISITIAHKTLENVVEVFFYISILNLTSLLLLMIRKNLKKKEEFSKNSDQVLTQSEQRELPTVTVAIPAYNEELNIKVLLSQILKQKKENFVLERIIVASDGSTDKTVEFAQLFKFQGVEVIAGEKNMGKNYRQNEIISMTKSDVLVIFDADIALTNNDVLSNLIRPIVEDNADLTSEWCVPINNNRTFLEKILCAGFNLKQYVYNNHKDGNNIYTCIGAVRAFSRDFYTNLRFLEKVTGGEDQYSYLSCVSQGFRYVRAKEVYTYFKLPSSFSDYKIYACRIFQTQLKFGDIFGENFVKKERELPLTLIIKGCIVSFVNDPLYTTLYVPLHLCMQYWALKQPVSKAVHYGASLSTKSIIKS